MIYSGGTILHGKAINLSCKPLFSFKDCPHFIHGVSELSKHAYEYQ